MVTAPPVVQPAEAPGLPRLAWLDALRGIAALAVVVEHTPWFLPELRSYSFNIGIYGVLVFFLVSGYIIPASLERRGDVRAFWIGRVFRLYPLYLAVLVLMLALSWWIPVRDAVPRDLSAVAAHATMLLDVVHTPAMINTMWTLSYEMIFYLVVTGLFVGGVHRRSGLYAIAFGTAAVAAGVLLPEAPLLHAGWPAYVSFGALVVGVGCLVWGRMRTAAAYVLGGGAVVLLMTSSYVPWLGAAILASMFAGTAIHRWESGAAPLWPVLAAGVLVMVSPVWAVQANWWWVQPPVWFATVGLAAASFAVAMALRRRRVPRVLAWLGMVSYSVYLVHYPLMKVGLKLTGDMRWAGRPLLAAGAAVFLAAVLLASWATHRLIELPMQRVGRRLARRFA